MTYTRAIGLGANRIIKLIVRGLALSKINPNVLTFFGLVINIVAASFLATGRFRTAGLVIIFAGLFDMVDGRVARATNQVTRFGGFFDSVLDRYSDLALLVGLLVYYGTINRPAYVVLTAVVMTASVMISYTRTRAENIIPTCKVGLYGKAGTRRTADYRGAVSPDGSRALGHCSFRKPDCGSPDDLHLPGSSAVGRGATTCPGWQPQLPVEPSRAPSIRLTPSQRELTLRCLVPSAWRKH